MQSAAITVDSNGPAIPWNGGSGTFYAAGTFGSGTLKLQFNDPAAPSTWIDVPGASLTATGMINFSIGCPPGTTPGVAGASLRVNMSGSTSPSVQYDVCAFMGRASNWN